MLFLIKISSTVSYISVCGGDGLEQQNTHTHIYIYNYTNYTERQTFKYIV